MRTNLTHPLCPPASAVPEGSEAEDVDGPRAPTDVIEPPGHRLCGVGVGPAGREEDVVAERQAGGEHRGVRAARSVRRLAGAEPARGGAAAAVAVEQQVAALRGMPAGDD